MLHIYTCQVVKNISNEDVARGSIKRNKKSFRMVKHIMQNVHTLLIFNLIPFEILILHGTFLFCWTPYAMLALAGIFGLDNIVPVELTVFVLYFAKVCSNYYKF